MSRGRITGLTVSDVRFPTSLARHGSDAMHPDPDYSAAYVVIETDAPDGLKGCGLTFTLGKGTEVGYLLELHFCKTMEKGKHVNLYCPGLSFGMTTQRQPEGEELCLSESETLHADSDSSSSYREQGLEDRGACQWRYDQ